MKTDFLLIMRRFRKLYETLSRPVCEAEHLTQTELDVLAFLANHPTRDTARDITKWRMLPKANVSQAVESLMQKRLLERKEDTADRRKIHLRLTKAGQKIVPGISASRQKMLEVMFRGISKEELTAYLALQMRMDQNVQSYLEGEKEEDDERE